LRWLVKYPDAAKVIRDYKRFGVPIPDELVAPALRDIEWDLWEAYHHLATCRHIGMDYGPIPWTAIQVYADRCVGMDRLLFTEIIRRVNVEHMSDDFDAEPFSPEMMRRGGKKR